MEVGGPTGRGKRAKALRLACTCPIEGVTVEASRAGTEGPRGRAVAEEARQGTFTDQVGPGAQAKTLASVLSKTE